MMKSIKITIKLILICILFATVAQAQEAVMVRNLKIGDQLPVFSIPKLLRSGGKPASTADYKGKLLILDFWSTGCSGCVAALPKMEALQRQFGEKIKILPVTREKEATVSQFWAANKYTKNLTLQSVVEDKLFSTYFKYKTIPHEVWVYKGKVVAITWPDYVDANNIQKILDGERVDWPVKNDFYVFDANKPLFSLNPDQVDTADSAISYAAISDYKEGVSSELTGGTGIVRDPKKKTIRTYFINYPIYNLYATSWMNIVGFEKNLVKPNAMPFPDPNEIVWEVADKSKYQFDPKNGYGQQFVTERGICYESLQPDAGQSDGELYKSVINNLNRLLGLNVRWEKRTEKVLVLVKTSNELKFAASKTGMSPSDIVWSINQQASNPYVFDETGYTGEGKLAVSITDWKDIEGINKVLASFGLSLKAEERQVDKFVFSELNGGMVLDGKSMALAKAKRDSQNGMKIPSAEEIAAFFPVNKKKVEVVTLPSGLQYKVLKKGNGPRPTQKSEVSVDYEGRLINGKIFESTHEMGKPASLHVADVIQGWREALLLMPVGSKWELYIPAKLAYGDRPSGSVPANSALIFELELLSIAN